LEILTGKVAPRDVVNKRAFLQSQQEAGAGAVVDTADADVGDLSFLQVQSPREKVGALLAKVRRSGTVAADPARENVIAHLKESGKRLKSQMLVALAMKLAADPFAKVKTLIQQLIERLLREAADEATKKGWCDTEMGKAKKERDFKQAKVMELTVELEKSQALKEKLELEIETLTGEIAELSDALSKATAMRAQEKEDNLDVMKKSDEGYAAVMEAIKILEEFYEKGAKATVLLQASPVDEDAPDVHSGAYKGKQEKAGGIIAILKNIASDFDRTNRKTKDAETMSHREFVEFSKTTKASIASKETDKKNKEADLEQTKIKIEEDLNDLKKNQELLDAALKELEELRPACVDTGMTYEERVAAREKEIEALKKALEILQPAA
jgi:hypothetical protein